MTLIIILFNDSKNFTKPAFTVEIKLQRICYGSWENGARNGVISIGQWGVFNHEKGAIWQSHLAAQKEGVVNVIIFCNHKTSSVKLIKPPLLTPLQTPLRNTRLRDKRKWHYNPITNPIKDPVKDILVPLLTNFNANGSVRWRTSLYLNLFHWPMGKNSGNGNGVCRYVRA